MSRLPGSSNEDQILFLVRWLNDHIQDSQNIQKPVLFAEFGVATKNISTEDSTLRDQFFNLVYSAIYSSASDSGAAVGFDIVLVVLFVHGFGYFGYFLHCFGYSSCSWFGLFFIV